MVRISDETIEKMWECCVDSATLFGIGYLSGRIVNWFTKWSSASSFFTKSSQIDLTSSAVCCALFAVIDRIAYAVLRSKFEEENIEAPLFSACRIAVSASAAIAVLNGVASFVQLSHVEAKPAVAVISTAIVIYSQVVMHLNLFNNRYT